MIKALIVDDESHARQAIRSILEAKIPDVQIIAEAHSVATATEILRKQECQLIFLDIDLPDGNGFDILRQIDHKNYRVIFITAYQEYAIQAIRFSALDYILKPINPGDLISAVDKCLAEEAGDEFEEKFQAFLANFNNSLPEPKKIVLKTAERIHVINTENIIRCEADNVYTSFYLNTNSQILVSKSIKTYEELLTPLGFLRVHQSHLVNLNFISYFDKTDGGMLVMTDQSTVPVSLKKKPILLSYLNKIQG